MSTNILNRDGVAAMVADCLKADTTTLYGASKLVQIITSDPILFIQAAVSINAPYKLFIWCPDNPTIVVRSQNSDEMFVLNYRVEGLAAVPETAFRNIDLIDMRVKKILNDEMYGGTVFTSYYFDPKAQVFDVERNDASIEISKDSGIIIAECKGAVNVRVNRLR
jgi:hypothetical protein